MEDYPNDPDDYPDVVQRQGHSGSSTYLILAIILLVIIFYRVPLYEFVEEQVSSVQQTVITPTIKDASSTTPQRFKESPVVTPQTTNKSVVVKPDDDRELTVDELVQMALAYERQGNRYMAHIYFQSFLSQLEAHPDNASVLLPAAVQFYSRGNELTRKELELLEQNASLAIKNN